MEWKTLYQVISSILGLTSTYMLTKGDGRGWALGALMSVFAALVYLQVPLYGSFSIQLMFFVIQMAGLWKWWTGVDKDMRKTSKRMTRKELVLVAFAWCLVTLTAGYLISTFTSGRLPYKDSFATTGNVVAQLTMMAGRPECWIAYMITNLSYIVVCYLSELHVYTVLYCVYMFVATRGWIQWTSQNKLAQEEEPGS